MEFHFEAIQPPTRTIHEICADRDSSYEIHSELYLRKILEHSTDFRFEFRKNDDPYGVDILCYCYEINGSKWQRRQTGSVEVELSEKWVDEYPSNWRWYSFLARKLFEFDPVSKTFDFSKLKESCRNMVYVIGNKKRTDFIAIDASKLLDEPIQWVEYEHRITGRPYGDTFIRFPLGSPFVYRGEQQVFEFIKSFFVSK